MTSFTAEIKPLSVCMHVSCDFPGNISRGWNSSVTVESINCLKTPFSFSFSSPYQVQTVITSSISSFPRTVQVPIHSRPAPKSVERHPRCAHPLIWDCLWEMETEINTCCCCYHAHGCSQLWGEAWSKDRGDSPAAPPNCKRKNLIAKCNGEGTWTWCAAKTQSWTLKSSRNKMQSISWITTGNPEDWSQCFWDKIYGCGCWSSPPQCQLCTGVIEPYCYQVLAFWSNWASQ